MSLLSKNVFKELLQEGTLCDTVIRVGDEDLRVHRIILCSCCSFFRDLFCNKASTPDQKVYIIPQVTPKVMRLILEYAYTHSVPVTEDNVVELVDGAERLSVDGIIQDCCVFLERKLNTNNCISIWNLAGYYKYTNLMEKAYIYIVQHFEEIATGSLEYQKLTDSQLVDLIGQNELNVKQESVVFEAILHWINYATEERMVHLPKLLSQVRLLLMPIQYLVDTVSSNELVRCNMECVNMVILNMKTLRESKMERPLDLYRLPSQVLLAVGGYVNSQNNFKIELYNVRTDRWATVYQDDNVLPEFCGCAYLDGFIYCVGGYCNGYYLSSVQKFDLAKGTWHSLGSMHMARCYVSIVVLNGHVYIMGGCNKYESVKIAERFEPSNNQWTLIAPMQEARADAGVATLHNKIYVCGGFVANDALASVECYDPETDHWTLIAKLELARTGPGVVAYNGCIYVIGGYDGTRHISRVSFYNPETNCWHPAASLHNRRSNFGVTVLEEKVYVVGGFLNNCCQLCTSVECYDGKANMWHDVQSLEMGRGAVTCFVVERIPHAVTYLS